MLHFGDRSEIAMLSGNLVCIQVVIRACESCDNNCADNPDFSPERFPDSSVRINIHCLIKMLALSLAEGMFAFCFMRKTLPSFLNEITHFLPSTYSLNLSI